MSIGSSDSTGHLTVTAPNAAALPQGPMTIATLVIHNWFNGNGFLYMVYQPSNFSQRGIYIDNSSEKAFWVPNVEAKLGFTQDIANPPMWYWSVVTKANGTVAPRAHFGVYSETGSLSWLHADGNATMNNNPPQEPADRISLGDEFGQAFRQNMAVFAAYLTDMTDSQVEALFVRSSASLMAASPCFMMQFPEANATDPVADLVGGGVETIRTGTWEATDDPPGYDYALTSGRTGKAKVWNGTGWDQRLAKVWNGTSWVSHPIKGFNGTDWITAK